MRDRTAASPARTGVAQGPVLGEGDQRLAQGVGLRSRQQPGLARQMSEEGPPRSTATTGRPLAWASSSTCPKVSVRLANRKMSALA